MASKDYYEGDERITVDMSAADVETGDGFVTITRYEKDRKGRRRFVESVCFGVEVWRQIVKDHAQ